MADFDDHDISEAMDGAALSERERVGSEIMARLVDQKRDGGDGADGSEWDAAWAQAIILAAAIVADVTGVENLLPGDKDGVETRGVQFSETPTDARR